MSQNGLILGDASRQIDGANTSSMVLHLYGTPADFQSTFGSSRPDSLASTKISRIALWDSVSAFRSLVYQWRALRDLVKTLPSYKTVNITFCSGMSFFRQVTPCIILGRFFGKEVVLSYRSNKAEAELDTYGRAFSPFFRLCDRIEVPCRHTAGVFQDFGYESTVRLPQVDTVLFRRRLIKSVQPRILITRYHERGNNITAAIRAFRMVKQKYPRSELVILGDGPRRRYFEWLVEDEKITGVTFAGHVDRTDMAKDMAAADVYLNCSSLDGLPLSLLEALHSGLPVISSPAGDIPAIIEDHVTGLLEDSANPSRIADRIIELVENPTLVERLSANSAEALDTLYSTERQRSDSNS